MSHYRFFIKKYKNGKRLSTEIDAIEFGGRNKTEMAKDLESKIVGMKELPKEADKDNKFVPLSIKKLL